MLIKNWTQVIFEKDHISGIPTGVNKKVIGMMKDEAGG